MLPGEADIAGGDLDRPDLQRFLIDPEVELAPDPSFRAAMLAHVPLAFAFHLVAGPVCHPAGHPAGMSREGTSRCSGPLEPRYGIVTFKVF